MRYYKTKYYPLFFFLIFRAYSAVQLREDLEEYLQNVQYLQTNPSIFNVSSQRCKTLVSGLRRKVFFFLLCLKRKEKKKKKSFISFLVKNSRDL